MKAIHSGHSLFISAKPIAFQRNICSASSLEIGRSLPIVFQRYWPRKFSRNSCKIGRFFREFAPENPAKFDFFFATYQKPCILKEQALVKQIEVVITVSYIFVPLTYLQIKNRDEMEKRTQTGLVMGHAYGVTAIKKVNFCNYTSLYSLITRGSTCTCIYFYF